MKALALNRAALVLALAGVFVSGVLSIGAFFVLQIPCGSSHGCDIVARHSSSHALGIPNAYLGLLAYLVLAGLAYWRLISPPGKRLLVIGYAIAALGSLASLVLTFVSITVIGATCLWCLSSAALMILSLIVHALLMQVASPSDIDAPKPAMTNGVFLAISGLATLVALGIVGGRIVAEGTRAGYTGDFTAERPESMYLPADAHTMGDPNAPIVLIEFGDLLCPTCQGDYGKVKQFLGLHPGKIKYVFREFPMFGLKGHEQAAPAAIAAEIAGEKGRFWQFLDGMYSQLRENVKDTQPILDCAASVGLDPKTTLERMQDEKDPAFQRMMKDIKDASSLGVEGTPTFFIIAKGVPGVRTCTPASVFDDLVLPDYAKLYGSG